MRPPAGDGKEPLFLRRYDIQRFSGTRCLEFIAPLEQKREIVESLAVTLEQLGGR